MPATSQGSFKAGLEDFPAECGLDRLAPRAQNQTMDKEWRSLRVGDLVERAAARWPERVFLRRGRSTGGEAWTFGRFRDEVRVLAAGFFAQGWPSGSRVALIADNCREWLLIDQALLKIGMVPVPRGKDSAPKELQKILEHSEALAVVLQDPALENRLWPEGRPGESQASSRKESGSGDTQSSSFQGVRSGEGRSGHIQVFSCQDLGPLKEEGRRILQDAERSRAFEEACASVKPEQLACLIYTSGTTGEPKGVMLSHRNLCANVAQALEALEIGENWRFLSILPSWHAFERIIEYVILARGCELIYTDQRRLKQDLRETSPQLVAFVPRIWEMLYAGLQKKLEAAPAYKRALLAPLRAWGRRLAKGRGGPGEARLHQRLSRLLLAPLWEAFGGELELAVSGGGALPLEVDRFLLSLGIPLRNGYGLTETSPVLSVRTQRGNRLSTIGPPVRDTQVRILSPEGYDLPPGEKGEIVVRGPQVMQGYFKNPEATRRVLLPGGWFRTGDLGMLDDQGWIHITGRAKDTIVLRGGENIEPEPIENQCRLSPWISQILLVGQDAKQLGALIVPDPDRLREEEKKNGAPLSPQALQDILRRELDHYLSEKEGFRKIDRVANFALLSEPFTQENGLMTATLKLKRKQIQTKYQPQIQSLLK